MSRGLITSQVLNTLTLFKETRSDDRELIRIVYMDYYDVFDEPFYMVMGRHDLPSFESIRRARQNIQAEREDLRAVPEVEKARIAKQEEYIEYARSDIRC